VSDRIIVMNEAAIAQDGAPRELYEQPVDRFVATFMGDANHLKATLVHLDAEHGELTIGGLRRRLPHRGLPPGEVDVAVRPEAILLGSPSPGDGLRGEISKLAYLGDHLEYTVTTPIGALFVTSALTHAPFPPGSAVGITLAERGISLIRP
jgi:iron(III) transport system ATP-binding protein